MNINPFFLCDFYKTVHGAQYNKKMTKMVSYFTPRMTRIPGWNKIVNFGEQGFCKQYLIDYFNINFFNRPKAEILAEYDRLYSNTIGAGVYNHSSHIGELHDLGYLPIEMKALPEGVMVNIGVPMIEVSNTHENFAWVTNAIETLISCSLWHMMICANVGKTYRDIVNHYYKLSVDDDVPCNRAIGDFSMRGEESLESAARSSAAWLLSFVNTATVPAILYHENYYNCNVTEEVVGKGSPSTEHSVMCSNYAIDGDEITMVKRLLTEIYPNNNFSMVSDSYDYWNMITEILPQCRTEIENHKGCLSIRGDSGDPVDIICGTLDFIKHCDIPVFNKEDAIYVNGEKLEAMRDKYIEVDGKYYSLMTDQYVQIIPTAEQKGTIRCLYEQFGGTLNTKGKRVLPSYIRAVYGDSITPNRAIKMFERLMLNSFACNNVSLGAGSFSKECWEDVTGKLYPFTRDTFGIAIKATYCELSDGQKINIFKNPKTDTGNFKKSQKGCCSVTYDYDENTFSYTDGHTYDEVTADASNLLQPIFRDGKMVKETSLAEIRNQLHNCF